MRLQSEENWFVENIDHIDRIKDSILLQIHNEEL